MIEMSEQEQEQASNLEAGDELGDRWRMGRLVRGRGCRLNIQDPRPS
jgi:hypothetical protein